MKPSLLKYFFFLALLLLLFQGIGKSEVFSGFGREVGMGIVYYVGELFNDLLHVKYTGYGDDVVSHSSKTTTVIGKYDPPGGEGTKKLIDSQLSKYVKVGEENPGGINVLNDLTNTQGWSDQLIWDQINKPWLDNSIDRGDVIRVVSDPTLPSNLYKNGVSGDLTFFGREHFHLTTVNDYTYDPSTFTYIK